MSENILNKKLYEEFKLSHLADGGTNPDAYAMSELICRAIMLKTYKIYQGGGYEYRTNNRIKNFDVVVWFNMGGDAYFQICMDNSDGDSCELWSSNADCTFLKKIM